MFNNSVYNICFECVHFGNVYIWRLKLHARSAVASYYFGTGIWVAGNIYTGLHFMQYP